MGIKLGGIELGAPNDRDWELAKLTILEIAKQSKNAAFTGKLKLFKAFYFAHLYFARSFSGLLSEWPIVRMPRGPGIDRFDELLHKLTQEGVLKIEPVMVGPFPSTKYKATGKQPPYDPLSEDAVTAIQEAVTFVADKTAAELSAITHDLSRSWNETKAGVELSIYTDLLSDEDHGALKSGLAELDSELDEAWGQ